MKLLMLSLGVSLIAYSPGYSTPHNQTHNSYSNKFFQTNTVTGKVTDNKGQPLSGVTVAAKGSQQKTMTNEEGVFTLEITSSVKILVLSYTGMETREVTITGEALNVQLQAADNSLDDVVVIGYGTQKKANLTGSVATVSGRTLTQRPAPNSANLLQGRIPGLVVTQPSSEPGRDNPNLLIRGRGSFGTSTDPLVLIDGVTGSLNSLAPDDIENITVLKDAASASIYGARAANGVVLVTTKKGKRGQTTTGYRFNIGRHSAIGLPDLITNSAEYMELFNQAATRSGLAPTNMFPQVEIDKYKNATDRNLYPNFDAIDYYFKPAMVQNHNVSVSGGGEKNTFNLSLSYLDQKTYFDQYDFNRYNALLNYTNQISDAVTVGTSMNLAYINRQEPPFSSQFMTLSVLATGPLYGPYLPDGSGRAASKAYAFEGRNRNVSEYPLMGSQYTKGYNLNAQAFVDVKLLKGLTWSTKFAVFYTDEFFKMHQVPYQAYLTQEKDPATGDYKLNTFGPDILGVTDQYTKIITPTVYSTLNYNTTIGDDHSISALAGYEQVYNRYQSLRARRINSVAPALDELAAYSPTGEAVYFFSFPSNHPRLPSISLPTEWALRSMFGRVAYAYKGKYLLEGNLRYDGTSKVSPDYRFGLFPSVSAGWVVSKEKFFNDKLPFIHAFKVRGSYGVLGNQDIDAYAYQNTLDINVSYPFDNTTLQQGAVVNSFKDQSIQWETTSMLDFGFDFTGWNGLLGVTFDWFHKTTDDILASQPVPQSLGLNAPTFNTGKLRNQGFELELNHQNQIGDVTYGVTAQIATVKNKVLEIKVPNKGSTIRDVNLPYDAHYLYVWDGIFQEEDLTDPKVPKHALNPNPKAGDLKMKDVTNDGIVDANDRVVVAGAYPDYTYSFGFKVGYKNFTLTTFFQGVQGITSRQTAWGSDPFQQGTAPTTKWRNAWTPQNRSNTLPGIYAGTYVGVTSYQASTFYLQDASYLRMKNIMLSYTLPKHLISKIKSKEFSVYVSADNLLTFTDFEFGDPERVGSAAAQPPYPQARILNAGINVKF